MTAEPPKSLILYHGTSTKHLDAILRDGLLPRRVTKRRSNWKGKIRSKPDFLYLTDTYPVYFAMNPALHRGKITSHVAIIKVEVPQSRLYPDEDFVSLELAGTYEMVPEINPADHKDRWRASLEHNGLVCTPRISVEQILDVKTIESNHFRLLMAIGGDAMPIPLNHRFMGSHYRRCLEALFEHGEEEALRVAASFWPLWNAS